MVLSLTRHPNYLQLISEQDFLHNQERCNEEQSDQSPENQCMMSAVRFSISGKITSISVFRVKRQHSLVSK